MNCPKCNHAILMEGVTICPMCGAALSLLPKPEPTPSAPITHSSREPKTLSLDESMDMEVKRTLGPNWEMIPAPTLEEMEQATEDEDSIDSKSSTRSTRSESYTPTYTGTPSYSQPDTTRLPLWMAVLIGGAIAICAYFVSSSILNSNTTEISAVINQTITTPTPMLGLNLSNADINSTSAETGVINSLLITLPVVMSLGFVIITISALLKPRW